MMTDLDVYDSQVRMSDLMPAGGTVLLQTDDDENLLELPHPPCNSHLLRAAERPPPVEDDINYLYDDWEELET